MNVQENKKQVLYAVEGNMGSGLTNFLKLLEKEMPEAHLIEHPSQQLQNLSQKKINLQQRYQKQPERWGFTFIVTVLFTRIQKMNEAIQRSPQKIKISQHSILADKHVCSQVMRDLGYLNQSEYQIFNSLYPTFLSLTNIQQTKMIYLRCAPEKCFQRVRMRLSEEASGQETFREIKLIHEKYEQWLKSYEPSKVLIIDTTENFNNDGQRIQEMMRKLKEFMQK